MNLDPLPSAHMLAYLLATWAQIRGPSELAVVYVSGGTDQKDLLDPHSWSLGERFEGGAWSPLPAARDPGLCPPPCAAPSAPALQDRGIGAAAVSNPSILAQRQHLPFFQERGGQR